jgi:hypothetical protein
VQISYNTSELKYCCQRLETAEAGFGRTYANTIITMVADAEAFDRVSDWQDFIGDDVVISGANSFSIAIGSRYTATFVSVDQNHRANGNGHIDWSSVQYIKLMSITERQ